MQFLNLFAAAAIIGFAAAAPTGAPTTAGAYSETLRGGGTESIDFWLKNP
jgi:hypothetical protein